MNNIHGRNTSCSCRNESESLLCGSALFLSADCVKPLQLLQFKWSPFYGNLTISPVMQDFGVSPIRHGCSKIRTIGAIYITKEKEKCNGLVQNDWDI